MSRFLILGALMLAVTISGCGPSEESKTAQQAEKQQTATEKVAEAAKTAAGEVEKAAEAVAEQAEEAKQEAEPTVKETAAEAQEMADQAAEKTEQMMADTGAAMDQAAETTAETAKEAAVAASMGAEKAVEATQQALTPEQEELVLEASFGNVTFPHAMHAEAYECSTCHGEGTPGLFGLDKTRAHDLCKGCHKQEGAGPTGCTDCHQK